MINGPLKSTGRALVRLIKSIPSADPSSARAADQVHCHVTKSGLASNPFVATALLTLYASLGYLRNARHLFDGIPQPGLIPFTALARAHATSGQPEQALHIFRSLISARLSPDPIALAIALSVCRQLGSFPTALAIHGLIAKAGIFIDPFLTTEFVGIYGDLGDLILARQLFDEVTQRTVVIWNAMIYQYIRHGFPEEAQSLFVEMPSRDIVSWNTMISGFARLGQYRNALALFREMELSGMRPNELTISIVLSVCAGLGALGCGIWVHSYIERHGMNSNGSLDHCLIDMYSKCGNIDKAIQVFYKFPVRRDLYSWTSVICGLAMHGRAGCALALFSRMCEVGVKPDEITLVGVLNACAHGGLVDQGCLFFRSMEEMYGISPKIEHYGCMIDLLGRVGRLREAYGLIQEMPMEPNAVVWGALLNACKVHSDLKLGEIAAIKLAELEPDDPWARVLMSNLYAECSDWGGVTKMRKELRGIGMRKMPGCSLIEVNDEVHEFLAGGSLHSEYPEICAMLAMIEAQMHIWSYLECQ